MDEEKREEQAIQPEDTAPVEEPVCPAPAEEAAAEEAPVEEEAPPAAPEVEEVSGEATRDAFDALKEKFNAIKNGDLPEGVNEVVEDLKRMGFEVKVKSKEYAKKLGESTEAYKAKAKAKAEELKKQSRVDELIYQIGDAAYDGHKTGEDVDAVLQYLYRKLDRILEDGPCCCQPSQAPEETKTEE